MAEIQRAITERLKAWKENPRRKPLVLQGARQVGKSWALKKFGKECFEDMVYINFDTMPAVKEDFKRTKEPLKLIRSMEMMTGKAISPSSTLIILDEIQECNEALNSLKYFCEDAPEYAVVCAGSLLGVALNRTGASFPVGKVDFMTLYPVSFAEYLRATDSRLYRSYQMIDEVMSVPEVLHQQLSGGICRTSWLVKTRSSAMAMCRKEAGHVSMREQSSGYAWLGWCIGFRR